MRKILILTLTILVNYSFAQTNLDSNPTERKGFVFGFGLGRSVSTLNTNDTIQTSFTSTMPNIKVGYMLNQRFALLALVTGANYKYKEENRAFEAAMVAGQYWLQDKWWALGGAGFTFDTPALFTVENPEVAEFYTGLPAFTVATGYEIWHKGKFTMDLQYHMFYGKSNLPNSGHRVGISNMFIVGINWY